MKKQLKRFLSRLKKILTKYSEGAYLEESKLSHNYKRLKRKSIK